MRIAIALGCAGLAVAGCTKTADVATTNTTPTATAPAAEATFKPPTSIARAEYGGRMERRLRKLDKNQDGKLTADEFPGNRGARMLKRMDANGDGAIDAAEWSAGMLARFDQRDVNKDGNLTSDERGGRGDRKGKGKRERMTGMEDDGDEVDNGM